MKTKIILFAMVVLMTACNTEPPVRNCTGTIVASLGCYDKETRETYYEGYIVITSAKDTILSFNLVVNDSIHRGYGIRRIYPDYEIPYKFSYKVLKSNDSRYVYYADIIQDAFHEGFPIPSKQAIITPCK